MQNVFASKTVYGGNWNVINSRSFNDEEKASVLRAEVVASQYGLSVCFMMRGGGKTYIPLSNDSSLNAGDSVDMNKARILTLHRDGQGDIERINI
jgi:hypothetical protein